MGSSSNYLNMPNVAGDQYILDLYLEIVGPYMGGLEPLTLQEIGAWCEFSGVSLSPWEAVTIRNMSRAYVVQFNRSNGTSEPAPYYRQTHKVDIGSKLDLMARRNGN